MKSAKRGDRSIASLGQSINQSILIVSIVNNDLTKSIGEISGFSTI